MTTYRLFPSTNGPSSPVSYSGNFLAGILFKVTAGGLWFNGYYHWVPTGGDTVARKFALWAITGNGTGTLLSAATVTSGTLTAGAWNFVPLATPIQLAPSTTYNACTGWSAVNGFPDSDTSGAGTGAGDSFGTGGHTAGITQGPLFAYSDQGLSAPEPHGMAQGVFGTGGTDPTVTMPSSASNSGNFWMDVQVGDTAPASYSGSYRLYPNKFDTNTVTSADSSVNYSVATEFHLSQPASLNKIWYYSPSGTTQLATSCRVWSIQGANSGTSVVTNTSPTWSGAAASGWVSCSFSNTVLPPGSYKVSVYNGAATPDGWGAKDANTNYWGTGDGGSGFTAGPLFFPGLSSASIAYKYVSGGAGNTPPYTDGSTTEAGQATFVNGTGDTYPYLYVDGLAQNYWVDVEVTPVVAVPTAQVPLVPPGRMSPMAFPWQFTPSVSGGTPSTTAPAGLATGTGAAQAPAALVQPNAGLATGTGTAQSPTALVQPAGGLATGTGTAQAPAALVQPNAGLAAGTGASLAPLGQGTGLASGTGTAQSPVPAVTAFAGLAAGTGTAQPPTVSTSSNTTANAGLATGTGTAQPPVALVQPGAGLASGSGTSQPPQALGTGLGHGTGTAQPPVPLVEPNAGLAAGTGTAQSPAALAQPVAGLASGTGTALQPTVSTSGGVTHTGTFLLVLPPGWRNQVESGPLNPVLPALGASLQGKVAHTGSFNVTIPQPGTGLNAVILESGPFNLVLPALRTSLSAVVTHTGGFSVSLPLPVLPLTGRAGRNNATTAMTLPALQTSISGAVTHVGVLTVSLAAPPPHLSRFEMFGVEERGALDVILPVLVTDLSAKVPDPPGIRTVFKAGRWIAARLPRRDKE